MADTLWRRFDGIPPNRANASSSVRLATRAPNPEVTDSVASRTPAGAATPSGFPTLSLVHLQRAPAEILPVQSLHGPRGIRIRHLHEAEAARLPGIAIGDHRDLLDGAMRLEQLPNSRFRGRERK